VSCRRRLINTVRSPLWMVTDGVHHGDLNGVPTRDVARSSQIRRGEGGRPGSDAPLLEAAEAELAEARQETRRDRRQPPACPSMRESLSPKWGRRGRPGRWDGRDRGPASERLFQVLGGAASSPPWPSLAEGYAGRPAQGGAPRQRSAFARLIAVSTTAARAFDELFSERWEIMAPRGERILVVRFGPAAARCSPRPLTSAGPTRPRWSRAIHGDTGSHSPLTLTPRVEQLPGRMWG
jgi:hypothetical protein